MRSEFSWLAMLVSTALTVSSPLAGELNPPGAPSPTPGPEPRIAINDVNTPGNDGAYFRITEPGSYRLEDNLIIPGTEPKHGILIESDNVTLDLCGFTLDGWNPIDVPHPNSSLSGIAVSGELESITVCNGVVRDWGEDGVGLGFGGGSRVQGVTVQGNVNYGIQVPDSSVLSHCIALDNGGRGFSVSGGSVVTECTAENNGAEGFFISTNTTVENCAAESNGESGFYLGARNQVRGCVAVGNASHGFETSTTDVRCLIVECVADGNDASGIVVGQVSTVRSCVVSSNDSGGIFAFDGSRLENNMSSAHPGFGGSAGAPGISINGDEVVVDGNHVWGNDVGIKVFNQSRCVIIRNTASENDTNYSISGSGNAVGPFIGAGNPITSTNPWANFDL